MISETIEILTITGERPCQIFTEALHDTILRIGSGVSIKIKRLLGHCDIVAIETARIEVREALISTLSAKLSGNAWINMHGSARFAKLALEGHAYFHIDTVELAERQKDQSATLDLGCINNSYRKVDEAQRRASIYKANAEITNFIQGLLPDVMPPPLAVNT